LKEISGYSNVTPKWVDEMKDQKFDSEVIENIAQYKAETDYWDNPYKEWKIATTDGDEYRVVGNEDLGLQIYRPNGEKFNDAVYSLDEAEVQINQDAMDYGYMSVADGSTQYEDYVGASRDDLNMDTYEEVLVTAPNLDDDFYGSHFSDYVNTTAHIRMADTLDGKRKKVIEIQSDLHQKGRQKGYLTKEEQKKIDEYETSQEIETDKTTQRNLMKEGRELEKELELTNTNFYAYVNTDMKELVNDVYGSHSNAMRKNPKLKLFFDKIVKSAPTDVGSIRNFYENIVPSDLYFDAGRSMYSPDRRGRNYTDLDSEELQRIYNEGVEELLKLNNFGEGLGKVSKGRRNIENKIEKNRDDAQKVYEKIDRKLGRKAIVDAPQKDERWVQDAVQRAINKARQEGKEGVEFVDSEYSLDIWNPNRVKNENGKVKYQELYQNIYDKKVPSTLKTYKNKYGGEVEKLEGGGYYYKFDDKSRDVKGIPLASVGGLLSIDQMQDDDKMNNKQGLLA